MLRPGVSPLSIVPPYWASLASQLYPEISCLFALKALGLQAHCSAHQLGGFSGSELEPSLWSSPQRHLQPTWSDDLSGARWLLWAYSGSCACLSVSYCVSSPLAWCRPSQSLCSPHPSNADSKRPAPLACEDFGDGRVNVITVWEAVHQLLPTISVWSVISSLHTLCFCSSAAGFRKVFLCYMDQVCEFEDSLVKTVSENQKESVFLFLIVEQFCYWIFIHWSGLL